MNRFFSEAVRQNNLNKLLALTAEAIVDIFEYQIGFICFNTFNSVEQNTKFIIEGATSRDKEEVVENLQSIEDEGEIYESMEEIWPDYPTDEDYLWNEDEY